MCMSVHVCGLVSHTDPKLHVSSLPPLLLSAGPKPQTILSGNKAIKSQQPSLSLPRPLLQFTSPCSTALHRFISKCASTIIFKGTADTELFLWAKITPAVITARLYKKLHMYFWFFLCTARKKNNRAVSISQWLMSNVNCFSWQQRKNLGVSLSFPLKVKNHTNI